MERCSFWSSFWSSNGFALSIVAGIFQIGKGLYDAYSKNKAGKEQDKLNAANYQRSLEQYNIDLGFNLQQNAFADEQRAYGQEQLAHSYALESWGLAKYAQAVASRAAEVAFREEQVRNKKFAGLVDYNAQKHVANILKVGAQEQAVIVLDDILRVNSANKREINVHSEKAMGTLVARDMSGIAQGASKDRLIVDAFRERNKAIGKQKSEATKSMIQVVNQKNKVINDQNLQVAASYRGLQALMKLRPAPVAHIPPPAPVFHGTQPIRPVGPAPIEGGNYVPYDSTANWINAGINIAGSSTVQNAYNSFGSTEDFNSVLNRF